MNVSTFDIEQRYRELASSNSIFSYLGDLSDSDLNRIFGSIELLLSSSHSSKLLKKKLFNLLIEISQNLYHYSQKEELGDNNLVFIIISEQDHTYQIITGNIIFNHEVASVRSRIEMVNSMNNEELKELYRGILDVGTVTSGNGAGLGLIDLARKSGRKLSYNFEEIDDKFSFFTLMVTFAAN